MNKKDKNSSKCYLPDFVFVADKKIYSSLIRMASRPGKPVQSIHGIAGSSLAARSLRVNQC